MTIGKAKRPGCSNSVGQGFNERVAENLSGLARDPFHIEAFLFLGELEMDPVACGETFQRFAVAPIGLVIKVLGLHKEELATALEDARVKTVEEITVAPFSHKGLRLSQAMCDDFEGDV